MNPAMTTASGDSRGFTLIELLVAAAIFTFIMTSVTGLFTSALDMQKRGIGIQKVEENSQFVLESIAREVRVSKVTSGNTVCDPGAITVPPEAHSLSIEHPVLGAITYEWKQDADRRGHVYRGVGGQTPAAITADDVDVVSLAFCVSAAGLHDGPARVTIPMTIRSTGGLQRTRVEASVQTTVISRDFASDLIP